MKKYIKFCGEVVILLITVFVTLITIMGCESLQEQNAFVQMFILSILLNYLSYKVVSKETLKKLHL